MTQYINPKLLNKYAKWVAVEDIQRECKKVLIKLRRNNERIK